MSKFGDFYRRNIYGVMGTLVFHILLVLVFLLADVDMKGYVKEEEIIIEFPEIVPEPEEPVGQESEQQDEMPNDPSSQSSGDPGRRTNRASNRLSSSEEFFDEGYMSEVEAARQLVADVNNQLSKEKVKLEDIQMPVETTEGMNPDSIKNIIYTGESNIVYYLENRYHLSLPVPVYLAQGGGQVIVDIAVNKNGRVVGASARKDESIRDEQIYFYAEIAASKTVFNANPAAPDIQKGTIHYTFIAQ
jgi:hypothetical protein